MAKINIKHEKITSNRNRCNHTDELQSFTNKFKIRYYESKKSTSRLNTFLLITNEIKIIQKANNNKK